MELKIRKRWWAVRKQWWWHTWSWRLVPFTYLNVPRTVRWYTPWQVGLCDASDNWRSRKLGCSFWTAVKYCRGCLDRALELSGYTWSEWCAIWVPGTNSPCARFFEDFCYKRRSDLSLPTEFELIGSDVVSLEVYLRAASCQLSISKTGIIATESVCNDWRAFANGQGQKVPDLEEKLGEVWRQLEDHSLLHHSFDKTGLYDVYRALHDHLNNPFHIVCKRAVTFRSASTRQIEAHGKTLRQSTWSASVPQPVSLNFGCCQKFVVGDV